jgi:hypothetical protein
LADASGWRCRFDLGIATRLYAGRHRLEKSPTNLAASFGWLSLPKPERVDAGLDCLLILSCDSLTQGI